MASAGGSYQERAAYDVKENVHIETTKRSGPGVYLADATNNTLAIATLGEHGGKTEKDRTETHIDSTRTAIVTDINAGAGAVNRNAGGDVLIEGSVIRGGQVNPLTAGGTVTAVAAVDTRHVEDSVFTSTIRWQSTDSTGSIEQTLHMPEIHGLPAHMSAYQGAGGVSVQLPAGSNVRTAIETLSKEPGQGYLGTLGERSDIDWQRVEELNKSLDFSKSGLTQEATIVVIIVVSILTYGAASGAGATAGNAVAVGAGEGVALSGGGTFLTATGTTISGVAGAAVTAGVTSLASTAAVSLINNQGDLGATLKELGSEDNAKGLLLTMATAGLTNGILGAIPLEGGGTLAGVNANSSVELLLARNAIQGISSAVLESAVMGTNLEDALKNNLKGALINTVAAQGAGSIGDAASKGTLDSTSKALAHALLGCAVGTATAGSSSGCAPGATGAVIGEIVAGLYGDSQNLGGLEDQLAKDPTNAALKQQVDQIRNTVTELAKLTGAGGALLIGGDASDMQTAMGTANNAAVNNYLNHTQWNDLAQQLQSCQSEADCNRIKAEFQALSAKQDAELRQACQDSSSAACRTQLTAAMQGSATQMQLVQSGLLADNYLGGSDLNAQARLIAVNTLKADIRAACASNAACTAKNDQALAALANTLLDLTPVIGDAKGFYEAETGLDYTLAVVGTVLPGAGDLAAKLIKEGRALFNAGDVAGAASKLKEANQTLHGVLIDAKAVSDRLTTLKANPEIKNVQLVEAGGKGNWSTTANGKLDADSAYVLSNGHAYVTDGAGRIKAVEGNLSLDKMDRNGYQQLCAGQSGCVGDDGGHMIASALGGSGDRINMVPQASTLNRGDWKAMENELAVYLKQGKEVSLKVDIGYPAGGGVRPNTFEVTAIVDGKELIRRFKQ